jgi:prepilin-type processing-associated H-X9-DG protein
MAGASGSGNGIKRAIQVFAGCLGGLVLVALLYPVWAGSPRSPHRKKQCLSQVKQNVSALLLYAEEYDDRLPHRDLWMDAIGIYTAREPFRCPQRPGIAGVPVETIYGYAFYAPISQASLSEMETPERIPLVFDSLHLARNASGTLDSLPSPGRHGGNNAIGYVDGHARYLVTQPASE